ncbi:MAG: AI-2E family transporter [Victivallaceae bacterium]
MSSNWIPKNNRVRSFFEKPAAKAFAAVSGLLHYSDNSTDEISCAVISLMKAVLWTDGTLGELEIEEFRNILVKDYPARKVELLTEELKSHETVDIPAKTAIVSQLPENEKIQIVKTLIELGIANGDYSEQKHDAIAEISRQLGLSPDAFKLQEENVTAAHASRKRLLKSGAGIIVALIVLTVFVLTATLLKSVLFGLILAYIFLPMEKWYERKLAGNGIISSIFKSLGQLGQPLKKLSALFQRKSPEPELSQEEQARRQRLKLISKATTLTVSSFAIILLILVILVSMFSANYVAGIGDSVKQWVGRKSAELNKRPAVTANNLATSSAKATEKPDTDETSTESPAVIAKSDFETSANNFSANVGKSAIEKFVSDLEKLKPKFQKIPLVRQAIDQVSAYINNADAQRELLGMLLKKSGGIFTFTAGFISRIFTIMLDILLTIFFFSLFLNKIAAFCSDENNGNNKQSEYLVKTIFNGKWLPGTNAESLEEGRRIISEVINKLKIWLRGYLTLIIIDTIVFSIAFYILGVPYAPILGLIAGCGVLLPYIGPVASAVFTILVTLAVGGADVTMLQIIGILAIYLIENGIVEQLFLYPAVIGESLGLSTLETIIVVLLGGIFAGITGMIFAIPAAAVLKYIVPQIYSCWE